MGEERQHIHSNTLLALGIITLTLCHKRASELDGCGLQRGFRDGHYAVMRDIPLTSDKGQRENGCLTRKERLQGASQRNEGIGGNGHCRAKVRIRHIHNGILYRNKWKGASNMQGSRWRVGDGMEYGTTRLYWFASISYQALTHYPQMTRAPSSLLPWSHRSSTAAPCSDSSPHFHDTRITPPVSTPMQSTSQSCCETRGADR